MYKLTRCVKKHNMREPMNRHHAFLMRYSRCHELKSTWPVGVITSFIMGNTGFSTRESQIILIRWHSFFILFVRDILHTWKVNIRNIVLTTVKLNDFWSLILIGLHKVQTQNLLFTFTWNIKRAQNNFVSIFNFKVGVRLIHKWDLYSSK